MKKYLVSLAVLALLASCGGGSGTKSSSDSAASTSSSSGASDLSSNPDYKAGLGVVAASDCLTCHDISTKKIGPAYQDVANKYAGVDTAVDYLAKKVIAGGSGVWGTVPMTAHATLSLDSAKMAVKYVLLLKTK